MLESALGMVRKQRSKGRQVHPTGPLETVDDSWKDDVRAEMRRRGWDQGDLAEQISVSPASITNMFKAGPRQIRFRGRIEAKFGWNANEQVRSMIETIARRASTLPPNEVEQVKNLVDLLASKR